MVKIIQGCVGELRSFCELHDGLDHIIVGLTKCFNGSISGAVSVVHNHGDVVWGETVFVKRCLVVLDIVISFQEGFNLLHMLHLLLFPTANFDVSNQLPMHLNIFKAFLSYKLKIFVKIVLFVVIIFSYRRLDCDSVQSLSIVTF